MFTDKDLELFKQRNVTVEQIEEQLNSFKKGFPFLKLVSAATVGNGILKMMRRTMCRFGMNICRAMAIS